MNWWLLLAAAVFVFIAAKYFSTRRASQGVQPRNDHRHSTAQSNATAPSSDEIRRRRLKRLEHSGAESSLTLDNARVPLPSPAVEPKSIPAAATASPSTSKASAEHIAHEEKPAPPTEDEKRKMDSRLLRMPSTSATQSMHSKEESAHPESRQKPPSATTGNANANIRKPEELAHALIQRVFRVTVTATATPTDFVFLPDLSKDIIASESAESTAPLLSASHIDAILLERLYHPPLGPLKGIEYLYGCYTRLCAEEKRNLSSAQSNFTPSDLLQTIRNAIFTYAAVLLIEAGEAAPLISDVVQTAASGAPALKHPLNVLERPAEFLKSLIAHTDKEDIIKMVGPALSEYVFANPIQFTRLADFLTLTARLQFAMSKTDILNSVLPILRAFTELVSEAPEIAAVLLQSPRFDPPEWTGRQLERQSALGPFFAVSTFPEDTPQVAGLYFANPSRLTVKDVDAHYATLRHQLRASRDYQHQLLKTLLKYPNTRDRTLDWLAHIVRANKPRTRLHMDLATTTGHGALINLAGVLARLSEPIIHGNRERWRELDPSYIAMSPRYEGFLTGETRLACDSEQLRTWREKKTAEQTSPSTTSMVNETFFATAFVLHVGLLKTVHYYGLVLRELSRLQVKRRDLMRSLGEAGASANTPLHQLADMLKARIDKLVSWKLAMDAQLLDPDMLAQVLSFYIGVGTWLVRLVDPKNKGLPLSDPPIEYALLPEFFVEDIAEFILFVFDFQDSVLGVTLGPLVTFLVYFLSSKRHVTNPYLRSRLVDVLYRMSPASIPPERVVGDSIAKRNCEAVFEILANHPLAHRHLTPALLGLYVDIEITGRHAQFYEKFSVRHNISLLMKYLRTIPEYEQSLQQISKRDSELFLRFVNMLLNDANFLLDDVILKLHEIRQTEAEMDNREQWLAQPENVRTEREENYFNTERHARSLAGLASETLDLMAYLSEKVPEPFLAPEIAARLAAMLNYFVVELAGPRVVDLVKVRDLQRRFGFHPRHWLRPLTRTYANLGSQPSFVRAVAEDARSFKPEVFERVRKILRAEELVDVRTVEAFDRVIESAKEAAATASREEEELGEIPDEFLDPITCVIMNDPVLLPSGHSVDRATITRHLLSDPIDPFTRAKLTIDMVKPNDELKAKIEEFKRVKKSKSTSGNA